MGSSNKIDISRFDPTNASDDQIRLWLFAIIQAELEKDDAEIDQELIDECSDCEAFLSHSNPEITQEEYAIGLVRIKERAQAIQAGGSKVTIQAKPKKRRLVRVAAYILAAALTVAVLSISIVAVANGSAAWEFITTNIQQILGMEPGDTLEGDKVTLVKGDLVAEYNSVEEALKAGGFSGILYPTDLPENNYVNRIIQMHNGNEPYYNLSFVFNTNEISYGISNYKDINIETWDNVETQFINNKTFYIVYIKDSNKYQAACYHNGFEHILKCSNYDDLLNILNNLKELER